VLLGAAWQRCRVHFMRNVLAQVPRGNSEMVAAAIRTVFAQPDAEHVHSQLDVIAGMLGRQFPKVETMLRDAEEDLPAFTGFPVSHWKKVWSTNPLERLKRRSSAAPTSWASSPTPKHCSASPAPCWSKPTTNGRSATVATSPKARWPPSAPSTTPPHR
jgi:transposase-like protein